MVAKTAYDSDLTPADVSDIALGAAAVLGSLANVRRRLATMFQFFIRDDFYADKTTFFAVLRANNAEFFETTTPYELGKMCAAVMALENDDAGSPR